MYPVMTSCVSVEGTTNLGPVTRLDSGEGQTEGATCALRCSRGSFSAREPVDHGVGIDVGDSCSSDLSERTQHSEPPADQHTHYHPAHPRQSGRAAAKPGSSITK